MYLGDREEACLILPDSRGIVGEQTQLTPALMEHTWVRGTGRDNNQITK